MTVQLGDYRIIRVDDLNWAVEKRTLSKKTGKVEWRDTLRFYYPTIKLAALKLFDLVVDPGDAKTLTDLIDAVDNARDAIVAAIEAR